MSVETGQFVPNNIGKEFSAEPTKQPGYLIRARRLRAAPPGDRFDAPEYPPDPSIEKREYTAEELVALRPQFAGGRAGQISFDTIASGARCEARVNPEDAREECGELPTCTLGMDIAGVGDYAVLPACSQRHWASIREDLENDPSARDSFDYNGFGRA